MFRAIKRFFDRQKQKNLERRLPESKFIVEITETEIINHRPEGRVERVALADLQSVIIETNDSGPFRADLWWFLFGSNPSSGCVYPGGATGEQAAAEVLQRLPGFNFDQFTQAMGSVENAKFVCWQSKPS